MRLFFNSLKLQRSLGLLAGFAFLLSGFLLPLSALADPTADGPDTAPAGDFSSGGAASAIGSAGGSAATCAINIFMGAGIGISASAVPAIASVPVDDFTNNSFQGSFADRDDVMSCLTRAIARALLQSMTVSIVNWIDDGFNGEPSFVQNYGEFFTNVANQAASQFLAGGDLAFLCSPFQLQVKIAVAQAYAMQDSPPQCTISGITSNLEGFMSDFSQGGWPAFLSYTTEPTNNPFGAYVSAQESFNSAVSSAQQQKSFDLQLGQGFLSFQQAQNCQTESASDAPSSSAGKQVTAVGNGEDKVCDLVNVTPGTAINNALDQAFGANVSSLVNAKYFDEIINALVSQLITSALGGLSNLVSGGAGYQDYTPTTINDLQSAGNLSQTISQSIQSALSTQQQVVSLEEKNVTDIETTENLGAEANECWAGTATIPGAPFASQQAAEQANQTATTNFAKLNTQLANYKTILAHATSTVAKLNALNEEAQTATSIGTLESVSQEFEAYSGSGSLATVGDIQNIQSDQNSLESQLTTLQNSEEASLSECQADKNINTASSTRSVTGIPNPSSGNYGQ